MSVARRGGPAVNPSATGGFSSMVRRIAGVLGELLVTAGVLVLLFVVYVLYVTDFLAALKQRDEQRALDSRWQATAPATPKPGPYAPESHRDPEPGEPFAKLRIPTVESKTFVVVQGVSLDDLYRGPGHYPESAMPGEVGNFSIAGHRAGRGAPFENNDRMSSCDPITVETRSRLYLYRVLPTSMDEWQRWRSIREATPRCAALPSALPGPYRGLLGKSIVAPTDTDVVSAVPNSTATLDETPSALPLITLTTCNPRYGNSERLIIHGLLVAYLDKSRATKEQRGDYDSWLPVRPASDGR
ncbi:hypothetical protein GCM10009624_36190 [Gordonia sinesedis]